MRTSIIHFLLLCTSLFWISCASTHQQEKLIDPFFKQTEWKVLPGATVDIKVQGEPTFSKKDLVVLEDGRLIYPKVGIFHASRYSPDKLKALIVKELTQKYFHNPIVTIAVKNRAEIYVMGEVLNPGLYEIDHPITILEAVKLAGSFSENSKRNNIRIVRQTPQGEKIKTISLKSIGATWIKNENIYVMPHDLIMVN